MTDIETIWRKIDMMTEDMQTTKTRLALVEREAENVKSESAKIASETKEQTRLFNKQSETISELKSDLRVLIVKFGCVMIVLTTVIEISIRLAEAWIKK